MFNKNAVRLVPVARNIIQKRCQSVIGGPPLNHVSKAEKVILGGGMAASLLIIPAWVLYHLREYKGKA